MTNADLPAAVLKRKAVVYVRQSTQTQVQSNIESQRRQYELVEVARTGATTRDGAWPRNAGRPDDFFSWRLTDFWNGTEVAPGNNALLGGACKMGTLP
jgi:hypothetical protein